MTATDTETAPETVTEAVTVVPALALSRIGHIGDEILADHPDWLPAIQRQPIADVDLRILRHVATAYDRCHAPSQAEIEKFIDDELATSVASKHCKDVWAWERRQEAAREQEQGALRRWYGPMSGSDDDEPQPEPDREPEPEKAPQMTMEIPVTDARTETFDRFNELHDGQGVQAE